MHRSARITRRGSASKPVKKPVKKIINTINVYGHPYLSENGPQNRGPRALAINQTVSLTSTATMCDTPNSELLKMSKLTYAAKTEIYHFLALLKSRGLSGSFFTKQV